MAYFLKKSNYKKGTYLQIYESFYDPERKGGSPLHRSEAAASGKGGVSRGGISSEHSLSPQVRFVPGDTHKERDGSVRSVPKNRAGISKSKKYLSFCCTLDSFVVL